jgi:hypothetical protein
LTEGDIGWIPYFIQKAEHTWEYHSGWTHHDFGQYRGPEEIFRKNILVCFISDQVGVELLDHFNTDNVCWESDFPHADGTWPEAPEHVERGLAGLADDVINKITHLNAIHHYRFDPFRFRPRDRCTVDALRADAQDVDVVTHVGRLADEREMQWYRSRGQGGKPVEPVR